MNITRNLINGALGAVLTCFLAGCATPKGVSVADKREYVRATSKQTLSDLYQMKPELRPLVESSVGYATFSNMNLKLFLIGGGQGYGLVVHNQTGEEFFMKMGELGAGIGLGVRDMRLVFVFKDAETLRYFVEKGWQFGGDADATAIAGGDKGVSAGATAKVNAEGVGVGGQGIASTESDTASVNESGGAGMEIYQITKNGLSLQAMVSGTKYWKDPELN